MLRIVEHGIKRWGRTIVQKGLRKGIDRQQRWWCKTVGPKRRCCVLSHLIQYGWIKRSYLSELTEQLCPDYQVRIRWRREANLGACPLEAAVTGLAVGCDE